MNGDEAEAKSLAGRLQDIFGHDNFFIELQDHGIPDQRKINPHLIEIAAPSRRRWSRRTTRTTAARDAVAHDALLCVQTGTTIDDPKRFKFEGSEHYLKSATEIRDLFHDHPDACDNTLWIAERANVEIELGKPVLPEFPIPPEFQAASPEDSAMAYLRHLAVQGAKERFGDPFPGEVEERLDYELGVIENMGFAAYFLVVWDLIAYTRSQGIRVGPGRGSAAGCLVAYCLRIVDIDPIRYGLVFERFLNPGRKQMPDIDMDFDERYRSQMIKYAAERYGYDHVAQIVTFSRIKARATVHNDGARPRIALHRRRPRREGDAAARDGAGYTAGRVLRKAEGLREFVRLGGWAAGDVRSGRRRENGDRRRPRTRGIAPPGRHPRRRSRDHQRAAHRVPTDPAQAGARAGSFRVADRHPVRDARRRGARAVEDGFSRTAQPVGDRDGARPHRTGDR